MTASEHRRRAHWSAGVAAVAALAAVVTVFVPDWIEVVFGVDPDGGDGALEWALPTLLALVALVGALRGIRHLHLSRV